MHDSNKNNPDEVKNTLGNQESPNNNVVSEKCAPTTGMTSMDLLRWILVNISWRIVGACIVLALLLLPLALLYKAIFPEWFPQKQPNYTEHILLLPASQLWMLTGIKVEADDELFIRVSGGVNLAYHRMIWSSLGDTKPSLPWKFIPGTPISDAIGPRPGVDSQDSSIHPQAPNGSVLLYISGSGSIPSSGNPRPSKFPSKDYIVISPNSPTEWKKITAKTSGEIYLVVDDAVADRLTSYVAEGAERYSNRVKTLKTIDESFRNQGDPIVELDSEKSREVGEYLGRFQGRPPKTPQEYMKLKKARWNELKDSNPDYRTLFHDDNVGFYLVTIRKTIG